MSDDPLPHRCKNIPCPMHSKQEQTFSPCLLPKRLGYRILSLDGSGVKGLALLVMLKRIEERCFGIPVIHLFDLVVGTSAGGQIALILNTQTSSGPLAVATAMEKFRELMKVSFPQNPLRSSLYESSPKLLESQLKALFGEEAKLFNGVVSHPYPNVAVATFALHTENTYLVTN